MCVSMCVFALIRFKMHNFTVNRMLSRYPINVFIE